MIFLSSIKLLRRFNLSNDGPLEASGLFQRAFGFFRFRFLLRRMIKYDGTILPADIGALPVARSRVVIGPENIEQLPIRDLPRIEFYFDYFGVTGFIRAHIFVGRVDHCTSGVTDRGISDAVEFAKNLLYSPKTAGAKRRFLRFHAGMIKPLPALCKVM
jgi:hypothetical protein